MILVVAMSENNVIGKDNKIPWHISSDLKRFKRLTINSTVIMGRKTYLSIGKPLVLRKNVILSKDKSFKPDGCIVISSFDEVIKSYSNQENIFIIGGSQIYKSFLPFARRIELTLIHEVFEGDAYFPALNLDEWKEIKREHNNPKNDEKYSYSFISLERKK